jgi:hypothetical protein
LRAVSPAVGNVPSRFCAGGEEIIEVGIAAMFCRSNRLRERIDARAV